MITDATINLSHFGYRAIEEAEQLLYEWNTQGLPEGFTDEQVQMFMVRFSGHVFLSNAENQVAMMNSGELEIYYTDGESGEAGFVEDLSDQALVNLGLKEVDDG